MWTKLWENVDQEIIEALTITGKGEFKILPKEQLEATYFGRTLAYSDDILRNRFHIILEDNLGIVYTIKQMKEWLQKLTDHLYWSKVEKTVQNSDAAGLSSNVSDSTATANDKSIYLGYTKGDNKTNNKQKSKSGGTDSNSFEKNSKEFVEINKDPDKNIYPTFKSFAAGHQLGDSEINDIGLQLNNMGGNTTSTSAGKSTGLSKNILKADTVKLNFSTAENLVAIINMKIPELRKVFYSKFETLFISIY